MNYPATIGIGLAALFLTSAVARQADAAATFSFSNVVMPDIFGDPPLTLSGSFTLPRLQAVGSTPNWAIGLTSVDLRVTNGTTTVMQFTDPMAFEFATGSGVDGSYDIEIETTISSYPRFLGVAIRDLGVISADFTADSQVGYLFQVPFPFEAPIPVTETAVDEPGSLTLLAVGIVGCAAFARRRSRAAAA